MREGLFVIHELMSQLQRAVDVRQRDGGMDFNAEGRLSRAEVSENVGVADEQKNLFLSWTDLIGER